jgi:hypothetical protein
MEKKVWVFNGNNSRFASGIFEDFVKAEAWIKENKLSGILTLYPLDKGVYQWAIENNLFAAKSEKHTTPEFIGAFTTASQDHYHYEDGVR